MQQDIGKKFTVFPCLFLQSSFDELFCCHSHHHLGHVALLHVDFNVNKVAGRVHQAQQQGKQVLPALQLQCSLGRFAESPTSAKKLIL